MDLQAAGLHPELFRSLPLGLVLLDRQGLVAHLNPSAVAIVGNLPTKTRWAQAVHNTFRLKSSDGHEVSLHDGRRIHVSTCPLPNKAGQLVILQDMTAARLLQEALDRQKRMDSMGQMLAALSHQLRTPLTTSMLHAGNLEWLLGDKLCPAGKSALGTLQQELSAIGQKISDLLLFARGGRVLYDIITIKELIADLRQHCQNPNWHNVKIDWRIECTGTEHSIQCNRNTLLSALGNLLNNAKEAGATAVQIQCNSDNNWLTLSLQDNGKGLTEAEMRQATEPFHSTKTTGTGLGLPVAKLIAEAHGGTLSLDKGDLWGGLGIILELPLQATVSFPSSGENAV